REQDRLDASGAILVALTLPGRGLEMPDRGGRGGTDRRWQRGGEDEAGRIGAYRVDYPGASGDISAEATEGLAERAFQDIDAVHDAVALGDTAATRAIHADRVDLVDIGHGAVSFREIAYLCQWRDVAVHRIEALAGDQLGPVRAGGAQQFFEMRHVVVAEHLALAAGPTNAFDHRIVVQGVRQDQAVRNEPGDGRNAGLVGDIARSEQQRRVLAVQVGKFQFELHQRVIGARDVAGSAGAGSDPRRGLDHGADHLGMLAHPE